MRFDQIAPDLLRACQRGDAGAFDSLGRALAPDLYAFVFSHLRDHDDTDEVVQECLVRLHRHLPGLSDLSRFPWWIMRMAVNQCHTLRGRATVRDIRPLDDAIEPAASQIVAGATRPASPREAAERIDVRNAVNAAIARLSPRQQSAIVLYELEERPVREIAEILECSEGAVKFNLHEARKKLQEFLRDQLAENRKEGAPRKEG